MMKNASTLLLKQSFKFCSTYGVCAKTFVLITDLSDYNVDSVKYRLIIINFQYFQRFVSNFIGSQKLYMASGVLDVIDNEGIFLCPRSRVHHEPSKGAISVWRFANLPPLKLRGMPCDPTVGRARKNLQNFRIFWGPPF